jgi:hypothetical protein
MTASMRRANALATSWSASAGSATKKVGARKMHAMFELHIEQGPILEAEGKDIGVVTHGQGLRWIECTVTGKESHTGSTPMAMRKNAGRGLALITELVHEIAMKNQPNAVGAIGHIDVYPNSRNIIPGKVVFTVDMRTHLLDKLNGMVDEFMERAPKLCEEIGVDFPPRSWASSTRPPLTRAAWPPCARPPRSWAIQPHGYRLGRGARCLLDQRCGPHGDDHDALRRRAEPQRGRGDFQGMGAGGHGCAAARGAEYGGDCGVRGCTFRACADNGTNELLLRAQEAPGHPRPGGGMNTRFQETP